MFRVYFVMKSEYNVHPKKNKADMLLTQTYLKLNSEIFTAKFKVYEDKFRLG